MTPSRRRSAAARLSMPGVCTVLAVLAAPVILQAQQSPAASRESYTSATIDAAGRLRIVTSDRRTIVIRKLARSRTHDSSGAQTSFDDPVISQDRHAVAAAALFGNCCTSYDIPLQIVVYSGGRLHRFEGDLPIFDWHFEGGGSRIAFSQQTVHFACSVHWELRDIATERRLEQVDIPEPCGQAPDPPTVAVPSWVRP